MRRCIRRAHSTRFAFAGTDERRSRLHAVGCRHARRPFEEPRMALAERLHVRREVVRLEAVDTLLSAASVARLNLRACRRLAHRREHDLAGCQHHRSWFEAGLRCTSPAELPPTGPPALRSCRRHRRHRFTPHGARTAWGQHATFHTSGASSRCAAFALRAISPAQLYQRRLKARCGVATDMIPPKTESGRRRWLCRDGCRPARCHEVGAAVGGWVCREGSACGCGHAEWGDSRSRVARDLRPSSPPGAEIRQPKGGAFVTCLSAR